MRLFSKNKKEADSSEKENSNFELNYRNIEVLFGENSFIQVDEKSFPIGEVLEIKRNSSLVKLYYKRNTLGNVKPLLENFVDYLKIKDPKCFGCSRNSESTVYDVYGFELLSRDSFLVKPQKIKYSVKKE